MSKKKDIMDSILTSHEEEFSNKTQKLDCLIYRNGEGVIPQKTTPREKDYWKVSKGNVSVEIWEGKAKIKVKMPSGAGSNISMKKLASIAVDAILEELKKEG